MKQTTNWKQLTIKQVAKLYSNKEVLTDWEIKYLISLKEQKFKVSAKQMEVVNKILGKISYYTSAEYYKKQAAYNKHSNIDAWTKIENNL
jgi:hypothetical protein